MYQTKNNALELDAGLTQVNSGGGNPSTILSTDLDSGSFASVKLLSSSQSASSPRKSWMIPTDFNGDGKTDLIWRDENTGNLQIWLMNGANTISVFQLEGMNRDWDFKIGDFNGDGKSDLFWRNYKTGENQVWYNNNNGNNFTKTNLIRVDPQTLGYWDFKVGDFDGDGKHDLMWRNYTNGQNAIWTIEGQEVTGRFLYTLDRENLKYDFLIGDFNGDGKTDLFWRHYQTGVNAVWLMDGFQFTQAEFVFTVNDFNWDAKIGDSNNDGKSDLFWNHLQNGEVAIWQFNGVQVQQAEIIIQIPDTDWEHAIGDVNGDGKTDLIWRNYRDNKVAIWEIDGFKFNGYFLGNPHKTVGSTEEFSVRDVNGDGKADLIWRNYESGDNRLWFISNQDANSQPLANLSRGWLLY